MDETTSTLVVHTPIPLIPLTQMIADMAQVEIDVTHSGNHCCFYGWGEKIEPERGCKPHHLIYGAESNHALIDIARTLHMLGYEVVVSEFDDWSEVITNIAPIRYENEHQH